MVDEINERDESEERDESAWEKLVELAEKEISGEPATNKDVANAFGPICCKIVHSEVFDNALEGVDSAVILKIRSWLNWYVLHQELEVSRLPRLFEKLATAVQLVFLSGVFALMFLFDRTTPSLVSHGAKIVVSIYGFVIFSAVSYFFNNMLQEAKVEIEVANLFLNSIKEIQLNQRERN